MIRVFCSRPARLPVLVVLFDASAAIDWPGLAGALDMVDPGGGWRVTAKNLREGRLRGRGCAIDLGWCGRPVRSDMIELALGRSFWCAAEPEVARLKRHRGQLSITCDLDCAEAEFATIRQVAKAMTLALALASRGEGCAGLYNAGHACAHTAGQIDALVAPLAGDEVPVRLFVWTDFHSTASDAVSLATAGLFPFVGHEVETWNAPGSLEFVGGALNDVLRYLLAEGPVVGHGDTLGHAPGELALRAFHGESRDPSRPAHVPALLLEFSGPETAMPRREI